MKIGIIGCGSICNAYFNGSKIFPMLEIAACADIRQDAAVAKAAEFKVTAMSVEKLLADPEIGMVINLTIPKAHAEITLNALNAGKHVYSEKPLAITREEGRLIQETAKTRKLRVGCAPDTFLGGGQQTCRKLLDDGWLGRPVAGTAFMLCHGPERWHPNPAFFYQKGAGPMFDMGPYYVTSLVHMLGPVRRVAAITGASLKERIAECKEHYGERLPVEIPTHYSGTLEFHNGALVTMVISFDVWAHGHAPIEIYGSNASLQVPDPNSFGGVPRLKNRDMKEWQDQCLSHGYSENTRSIGAADMVCAIQANRPHRCGLSLANHILDVMHSFEESSVTRQAVEIKTTCDRPAPLPLGLIPGQVDL
ncbi:MAG: Gfo/Idh/MocA family oxidoreductase [Verrucomicrobiae bacterium]|nr:Gfo/Idh/MocA family oxidoreductase [Verrucomicrobiae bacterium]